MIAQLLGGRVNLIFVCYTIVASQLLEVLFNFAFFLKKIVIYLFIYFWLHWAFVAARGLSLVAASRSHSSLQCVALSLRWPLPLWSMAPGARASAVVARGPQQLWHTGLVAAQHVGSSWTRT